MARGTELRCVPHVGCWPGKARWRRAANATSETKVGYGAPGPGALLAAALIHAFVLGLMLLPPPNRPPARPSAARALSVTLVSAPDKRPAQESRALADAAVADGPRETPTAPPREDVPAAAPREPPAASPRDAAPAAAPAGELHVAESSPPARGASEAPARPRALPRPPQPKPAPPPARESEETAAPSVIAGTAIYRVGVNAQGSISGIELLHSSGTAALDAAGESLIRTAMEADRPAAETAFTVTIRFTPEGIAAAQ